MIRKAGRPKDTKPLIPEIKQAILKLMKEGCVKDKESQPTLDADGSFETNNLDKSLMSVKREQPLTYMLEDVIARAMKVR